jgi:hypothetical protein
MAKMARGRLVSLDKGADDGAREHVPTGWAEQKKIVIREALPFFLKADDFSLQEGDLPVEFLDLLLVGGEMDGTGVVLSREPA